MTLVGGGRDNSDHLALDTAESRFTAHQSNVKIKMGPKRRRIEAVNLQNIVHAAPRLGHPVIKPAQFPCPAPVCYPNWKARVFVKFGPGLISSSLEKLAFRENSNGVK